MGAQLLDPTITLGSLLSIVVTAIGMLGVVWKVSLVFARMEGLYAMKMDLLWRDYKKKHGISEAPDTPQK